MTLRTQMRRDAPLVIEATSETITIRRRAVTYNAQGESVTTWNLVGTAIGDVQPRRGSRERGEGHLELMSDSIVMLPYNTNILADDRVYRVDGTFYLVDYVDYYEGHITVFMTLKKGVQ